MWWRCCARRTLPWSGPSTGTTSTSAAAQCVHVAKVPLHTDFRAEVHAAAAATQGGEGGWDSDQGPVHLLPPSHREDADAQGNLFALLKPLDCRQNRKNDEQSYMNMLKLRRDMDRARTIIDLVKKREKLKREALCQDWEVIQARYVAERMFAGLVTRVSCVLGDWDGTTTQRLQPPPRATRLPSPPPLPRLLIRTTSATSMESEAALQLMPLICAGKHMTSRRRTSRRLHSPTCASARSSAFASAGRWMMHIPPPSASLPIAFQLADFVTQRGRR